jgi:hypothetical protein
MLPTPRAFDEFRVYNKALSAQEKFQHWRYWKTRTLTSFHKRGGSNAASFSGQINHANHPQFSLLSTVAMQ